MWNRTIYVFRLNFYFEDSHCRVAIFTVTFIPSLSIGCVCVYGCKAVFFSMILMTTMALSLLFVKSLRSIKIIQEDSKQIWEFMVIYASTVSNSACKRREKKIHRRTASNNSSDSSVFPLRKHKYNLMFLFICIYSEMG